jgi:hypothetical protein
MRRPIRLLLLAAVILFASGTPTLAQVEQGTITGTVTDQTGAVIPGAQVKVTNIQTRINRTMQTNSEGHYNVPYLPSGQYEVEVESRGFTKAKVVEIKVAIGQVATINITLAAGPAASETVTITAGAAQLERQNASLGNVVDSRQIIELPLLGRNPYDLVTLAPGVLDRGNGGSGPIIDGGRSNTSEILFDGAETRNSTTNDIGYRPPLETVLEFKVITNGMAAEFGRTGGGVLTAASRSGTNQLHGSVYEFLRNDKLNANSWASNRVGLPRTAFRRNEYGFAVGGPAYIPKIYDGRNKTFFFVNWEQIKQRSPDDIIVTLPTALQRAGDFSQTFDGQGNLIKIYDPLTTRPDPAQPGRYTRDQFSCNGRLNVICADRIDPIANKIMQFYPLPNRTTLTQNFVRNTSRLNDSTNLFLKLDHNLGSKHHLFGTYGRTTNPRFTAGLNDAFPGEGVNGERGEISSHNQTAVLSDTITFRPNLIGEFRASISRARVYTQPRSVGFDFTQLGIAQVVKDNAGSLLFPRMDVTDVESLGPDRASYFNDIEQSEEAQGHVSWLKGAHSLKTGFNFTFSAFNVFRPERPAGLYQFGRGFTQGPDPATASAAAGFGVATFLLGAPTGGQLTKDPTLAASQKYYSFYVQDDWKALRNLSFNLGMRWEYQTPWTDRFNQLAFFDPDATDPLTGRKGVLDFVGRNGNSRYQSDPDKNNFAPRIGLAWSFRNNMVIRANYGMFYFPGSGGIGSGASDLGSGFLATTSTFIGQPPAAPNTPPAGASLSNAFLAGFLPSPTTGVGGGLNTALRQWVTPYIQQWNLNIQRELGPDMLLEIAYVGSRGQRIWINLNRNAVSTDYLSLGTQLDTQMTNPFFGLVPGSLGAARTTTRSQLLRPYPHYTDITRFRDPVGDSIYHGMTVKIDKRLKNGLSFQAAYTVAKLIDNVQERFGGRSAFIDPNDLGRSRSISDEDRSQVVKINYIWDLPFGHDRRWVKGGIAAALLGNWQASGITTFATGKPVIITAPNNTRLPGVGAVAIRLKSPVLPSDQQTTNRWFDTSAFVAAPQFSLGNDSRTQPNLRGPGITRFDIKLSRRQRIKEGINLEFRTEFFNAFNTPQLGDPVGNITSVDFGKITSSGQTRNIQFGLRLSF